MTQVFDRSNHAFETTFLTFLAILLIVISSSTVVLGYKTGELSAKIIRPLKYNALYLYKQMSQSNQTLPENNINSSSSSNVDVNINSGSQNYNQPPQPAQTNWNWPVYNTPTPNPTVVEWNRQFELKQQEMQKQFEESKQKVCAAMPDAPGCH